MNLVEIALSQYGQSEVKGEMNNPSIVNYSKELGRGFSWINDDETAWCSVFINWVAMKAGLERSNRANARSWLNVGEEIEYPKTGDIVIFKRGNNPKQGHVGIYINKTDKYVRVLGGNQSNRVQISENYKLSSVIGYRRLKQI